MLGRQHRIGRDMPGIDGVRPHRTEAIPTRPDHRGILVADHRLEGEIPGEAFAAVEHEGDAAGGMPRRGHHLPRDPEGGESLTGISAAEHHIPRGADRGVGLARLDPPRHPLDVGDLLLEDPERHAAPFEILGAPRVIDVVVRRKPRADGGERDILAPELVLERPQHPDPAEVDEEAGIPCPDHPDIGGAVADVDDGRRRHLGCSRPPAGRASHRAH